MVKAEIVTITTPDKVLLRGLWLGPTISKDAVVFIHGLGSDMFALERLTQGLASDGLGVLVFNNRGYGGVNDMRVVDKRKKKGYRSLPAGAAHEMFTNSAYDVQGAVNFCKSKGIKRVFLLGHSTGCQKSVYYLSQRGKSKQIAGAILLAPMSDQSSIAEMERKGGSYKPALAYAKKIVKANPHALLPEDIWPELSDAQRFLSLYTYNTPEDVFPYYNPKRKHNLLKKIATPLIILLGQYDQYRDRPIRQIKKWFEKHTNKSAKAAIVSGADHSFKGYEDDVKKLVLAFIHSKIH